MELKLASQDANGRHYLGSAARSPSIIQEMQQAQGCDEDH